MSEKVGLDDYLLDHDTNDLEELIQDTEEFRTMYKEAWERLDQASGTSDLTDEFYRLVNQMERGHREELRNRFKQKPKFRAGFFDDQLKEVRSESFESETLINDKHPQANSFIEILSQMTFESGEPKIDQLAHASARWFHQREEVLYVTPPGRLYRFRDGIWVDNGEQYIQEELVALLKDRFSSRLRRETMEHLRGLASQSIDSMGPTNQHVPVQNGHLNLESVLQSDKLSEKHLEPTEKEHHLLWRLPVKFDPEVSSTRFRDYLEQCVSGDTYEKLQEFLGYCLQYGSVNHKKMLLLLGPTDSGKSVFLDVAEALFGSSIVGSMSPQFLANERWGIDGLVGKPVNIRHDLDPSVIKHPGILKELADGNPVKAEAKGKDPYQARLTTKHLFSANEVSAVKNNDLAFLNRWLIAEFPDRIPQEDQNLNLSDKLTSPEVLSEVLNFALEGLRRLERRGHFTSQRTPEEVRDCFQMYGTSIQRFIHECVNSDPDAGITSEELYEKYEEFAYKNSLETKNQKELTRQVKNLDSSCYTRGLRVNQSQKRGFQGISVNL